jgi:hypothetical protein
MDLEIVVVVDVPNPDRERVAREENDPIAASAGAIVDYRVGERGFGSALRWGFARATGDVIIPYMGDACDDPADVRRLVELVSRGWDVVSGSRYMPGGRIVGNSLKQRLSKMYSILVRFAGGPNIHDISNSFKAYRREVVEQISMVANSFDLSVELTLKAARAGFTVTEVPTVWTNRQIGESNFHFWRELRNYGRWLIYALTTRSGGHRSRRLPASDR